MDKSPSTTVVMTQRFLVSDSTPSIVTTKGITVITRSIAASMYKV